VHTDMLTIGAFAKACRLSPKALRLYDELDLLRPARVDPDTGYRYYAVGQLEQAQLVAWLRRLGMPLAEIRQVCRLHDRDSTAAAREIRAYWARVEAETAVRRDLAAFLVAHLTADSPESRKDTAMLELRYSAHSDTGRVRQANEDAALVTENLFVVADGVGGHRAGEVASVTAVETLRFQHLAIAYTLSCRFPELVRTFRAALRRRIDAVTARAAVLLRREDLDPHDEHDHDAPSGNGAAHGAVGPP
jgi:DNA-binding transcriptional MerR regulator